MFVPTADSSEDTNLEIKLKTAYLINIISFVRWPHGNDQIVLCVNGNSPVFQLVSPQNGRLVGDNKFLRIQRAEMSLEHCDVLYWDATLEGLTHYDSTNEKAKNLLTISDQKDALEADFAVQFYTRNLKLRFALNDDVIKRANYSVSSKLMRLSKQVD